jgi:hypothetical protein
VLMCVSMYVSCFAGPRHPYGSHGSPHRVIADMVVAQIRKHHHELVVSLQQDLYTYGFRFEARRDTRKPTPTPTSICQLRMLHVGLEPGSMQPGKIKPR